MVDMQEAMDKALELFGKQQADPNAKVGDELAQQAALYGNMVADQNDDSWVNGIVSYMNYCAGDWQQAWKLSDKALKADPTNYWACWSQFWMSVDGFAATPDQGASNSFRFGFAVGKMFAARPRFEKATDALLAAYKVNVIDPERDGLNSVGIAQLMVENVVSVLLDPAVKRRDKAQAFLDAVLSTEWNKLELDEEQRASLKSIILSAQARLHSIRR